MFGMRNNNIAGMRYMNPKSNSLTEMEVSEDEPEEVMQGGNQRVHMDPDDIGRLLSLQGGEDYDDEGNPLLAKLGELLENEDILHLVLQALHNKMTSHQSGIDEMRSMGEGSDTEVAVLPENLVNLFDEITGSDNINSETGHKQYASMSGFINGLSNLLPGFSRNNSSQNSGIVDLRAPTSNNVPSLYNMYPSMGGGAFNGLSSAASSFGNMFNRGLNNFSNGMSNLGNNLYGRGEDAMYSFGRMMDNFPSWNRGSGQTNMAPSSSPGTYEDYWRGIGSNVGRTIGSPIGGFVSGELGRRAGSGLGGMAGGFTPMPFGSSLGSMGGGYLGQRLGSYTGNYLGGNMGSNIGSGALGYLGRGMDSVANMFGGGNGGYMPVPQNSNSGNPFAGLANTSSQPNPFQNQTMGRDSLFGGYDNSPMLANPFPAQMGGYGMQGMGGNPFGMSQPPAQNMGGLGGMLGGGNPFGRSRSDSMNSFQTAYGGDDDYQNQIEDID